MTGRPPPTLGPMALGPAAPARSVPGTFSQRGSRWRRRQASGCAPAGARAADTHVEGGRGGARGDPPGPGPAPEVTGTRGCCSAHGWHPVTPEAQAGAGPPRCPPPLPQRTHPGTGARAPGHPGAPASCTARAPAAAARTSLCRQPDKAPARGPLHHLPETRVFVTCRWAPSPTHPHMPTHPHVPAPTGRAERKPALLLGPSRSQTHAEGHNRSASPSHVEGPQPARGSAVGGWGGPPGKAAAGWGREGSASGQAPRPVSAASPSLPSCPARPAGQAFPVNRSPPRAGLVCAARLRNGRGHAVGSCASSQRLQPLLPALSPPGHFPGRAARNQLGSEKGLPA